MVFHLLNPDPNYGFVMFWFSKTNKNLFREKKRRFINKTTLFSDSPAKVGFKTKIAATKKYGSS
jgi:hypothetical protein